MIFTKKSSNERVGGPPIVNISDGFGGLWSQVGKPWRRLTIIHQFAAAVGDDLWDRGVCWGKLAIVSTYSEQGARNLMEIVGASTSARDMWLVIGLVGTDHGTGAGAAAAGRNNRPRINACWRYLAQL